MRWPFRSLLSQLVALVVAALVAAQAISLWLFVDERGLAIRAAFGFEAAGRAANVARLIEQAPPELRPSILRAADSPLIRFSLDDRPSVAHLGHDDGGRIERRIRALLDDPAPREIRVEAHEIDRQLMPMPHLSPEMARMHRAMMRGGMHAREMNLSIALSDGRWLNVGTRLERPPLQWPLFSTLSFGVTAALILIAAFWFLVARITRPLRSLASAAERFGRGEEAPALPVTGPEEVRDLTRAFNRMQERLTRFVADRTRILAAVSHDLRSPLTALRVRAEMVDDEETRDALVESIEEMQRMAEATLTFAKGLAGSEPRETVDFAALAGEVAAEAPGEVVLEGGPDLSVRLRPVAFRRALRNVVENAIRYGGRARVSWRVEGAELAILVEDDGPGAPEAELERLFDPFYRLEDSRSLDTGGHGLGLSIARSILRAHGGDVSLANRAEGGLAARLTLPRVGSDEIPERISERHKARDTEEKELRNDADGENFDDGRGPRAPSGRLGSRLG